MNKVLIYSKDIDFLRDVNSLMSSYNTVQINFSNNLKDLQNKLEKFNFILVIIDLDKNNEKIDCKYLSRLNINNIAFLYTKSTIIDEYIIKNNKFILKEKDLNVLKSMLSYDIFDEDNSFLVSYTKKKIMKEINELKFEVTNIGVQYLIECILIIKSNDLLYNLEKEIYPLVAKKYNVTSNRVKWNISSCINTMYKNNDLNSINRYFGFTYDRSPTPKMLIFTILNKL